MLWRYCKAYSDRSPHRSCEGCLSECFPAEANASMPANNKLPIGYIVFALRHAANGARVGCIKPLDLEVGFEASKNEVEVLHNEVCSGQGGAITLLSSSRPRVPNRPGRKLPGDATVLLTCVSEMRHRVRSLNCSLT
jgi:hypothetical protein